VKSLFDQVKDTMLVTTFVFLGVEGASVYSRFARRREDVGRATLLGFLSRPAEAAICVGLVVAATVG
jgi:amino acid transporter